MRSEDSTGAFSSAGRPDGAQPSVTLDGFCAATLLAGGVRLADLSPLDQIEVRTRNSCYRVTILDPVLGRVLVQGGAFFPVTSEARVAGATLGGSLLKLGWIGCGFCLEIHAEQQSIVTTPVQEVRRAGDEDERRSTATPA